MEPQAQKYAVYAVIAAATAIGLIVGWIAGTNVEDSAPLTIDKDILSNNTAQSSVESTQVLKKFSSNDELRAI